ncbi:MAG TPA: hypothetical protein PLN43_02895 [Anaerolineales bacterium]|nr:hypothetical protein [Anaerolineales bacterium]
MKVFQFLFRVGFSLSIAFALTFSSAIIFFDYSGYETALDRAALVSFPTLAIGFLLFQAFPTLWQWIRQRRPAVLFLLGGLAGIGAAAVVLPFAVSSVYYLGTLAFALALFALMLPAAPIVERMRNRLWGYSFGFLLSLLFAYGAVGFLAGALHSIFNVLVFTVILVGAGSVAGNYLFIRAADSFRGGFLRQPLNLLLALALPAFLAAVIAVGMQFPPMLLRQHLMVPREWFGLFLSAALMTGVWGLGLLEQFETRGFHNRLEKTRLFEFIKPNLPGVYAGGMFFLINLVIARILNHPALSVNTVLFESDAGPWLFILGSPTGDALNRSVHPLALTTIRYLVRVFAIFMGDAWQLAPILVAAMLSGLCVFMAWLFVKRAVGKSSYAFIFAVMLGSTAAHLFFGSLTDTYIFGVTSLIFFWLLIQAQENRFAVLVPAGVLVFGVTVTNIAQAMIGLFCSKFGFRRLIRYGIVVLAVSIVLTAFTSMVYPHWQTFFFVPADLAFEGNFVKPVYESPTERLLERFKLVGRSMVLYGVTAPSPIEVIAEKDPRPTIDLKTFDAPNNAYASYKGFANIPLALWLALLAGAFIFFMKGLRSSAHLSLMLGLLGSLAFNFILHMNYGTELFLYALYWTYLLVFFLALAYAGLAGRPWFEAILTLFILALMANNLGFIFAVLRGLAPFFASV